MFCLYYRNITCLQKPEFRNLINPEAPELPVTYYTPDMQCKLLHGSFSKYCNGIFIGHNK
jgi:hypothetical protein